MTGTAASGSARSRSLRSRLGVVAAGLALAGTAAVGSAPLAGSASPVNTGTNRVPIVGLRHSTSTNWSGYAADGPPGAFTSVTATWVQPSVSCTSQNAYSAYWVGLDGDNTNTVEQLGTEADCLSGSPSFYAWFEMYPRPEYLINTVIVRPGDSYTASVTYQGSGGFLLTLRDATTGTSFSTTQKLSSARLASAETIVEAPWSGGVLPLANFGKASFSGATANGSPLGGFSTIDPITMHDPYGMVATPSRFKSGNTAFSVTWSAS